MTTAACFFLFKKHGKEFTVDLKRKMVGALIFPLFLAYDFLVLGLVIFPFCFFLLQYISYAWTLYVGSLTLLPFLIIEGALFLPESRAGRGLRGLIHKRTYFVDKKV